MPETAGKDFRVVCLGGSAGGLAAYRDILRSLPGDTGMAFVIAPHRSHECSELLPHLLARVTTMPVADVVHGMRLIPNRVFIMPPGQSMTIEQDRFLLGTTAKAQGWPQTISILLLSLAEGYRDRVIAVILSGMDHDGSAALRAIKNAGGMTFAQSDAEYPSMPRSAVATGYVDFILAPAEIAATLLSLPKR